MLNFSYFWMQYISMERKLLKWKPPGTWFERLSGIHPADRRILFRGIGLRMARSGVACFALVGSYYLAIDYLLWPESFCDWFFLLEHDFCPGAQSMYFVLINSKVSIVTAIKKSFRSNLYSLNIHYLIFVRKHDSEPNCDISYPYETHVP